MASIPPLPVEDQTDEDFFDKLVEDEFRPTMTASSPAAAAISISRSESDDGRAFANMNIRDDSGNEGPMHEEKDMSDSSAVDESALAASKVMKNDQASVESHTLGTSTVLASDTNGVIGLEDEGPKWKAEVVLVSDSIGTTLANGSGGFGVKEVGWNSFFAVSSDSFGHGESDFFSELGNNAVDFPGYVKDCANGGVGITMENSQSKDFGSDSTVNYGELYESQLDGNSIDHTANGQHSSDHYWENMYPGWKCDPATGQVYKVDSHAQTMDSQQGNGDLAVVWDEASNGTSEVAYLRQSSQSVVSTIAETSITESSSNWNQRYQVNGGYPEHMIFDPLYPGWYYDIIVQEWRVLDVYNVPFQSAGGVHDHQRQNGYASIDAYSNDGASRMLSENGQTGEHVSEDFSRQGQPLSRTNLSGGFNEKGTDTGKPEIVAKVETTSLSTNVSGFDGTRQVGTFYGSNGFINHLATQRMSSVQSYDKMSQGFFETNGVAVAHNFDPDVNFSRQQDAKNVKQTGQMGFPNDFFESNQAVNVPLQSLEATQHLPYAPSSGRSPDGRPQHALATFGFGGKLLVMKDNSHLQSSLLVTQTSGRSLISILNLMEVVTGDNSSSSDGTGISSYFGVLCQQSFPGPLTGGSMGSKNLNKWIDERISNCESLGSDYRKSELLKLLLSLLKISCQHYGKLRSPFGADPTLREHHSPESAVAKLFASTEKNGMDYCTYSTRSQCLQHIPPEERLHTTASEVQNLLVSGRKVEALQCAQEGQMWGPALIIATQLGEQFYVDTVKQMALRQLVAGTPLRTLCLLIAGQPAEIFSSNNMSDSGLTGSMIMSHQNQHGCNRMLDDWEKNLAVIAANRTKDDELVITHLGDCLWKERSEIVAAHICYIIAGMNFEAHSDTARLCLIGADHWKFPRTYASPEAIQRTELYEYSKVLGNSQYILLPFQPYKIIYAFMLAEVGKLSDALKYCQAVLKSLKTGRAPEVDAWKQLVVSLEDRIVIHQQGGYTNLAPAKLVGKLLNFFDSTASRVVGGLPPPAPAQGHGQDNGRHHNQVASRVSTSQSTMAMSSLVPSASMEPIGAWAGNGSKMTMHNRSVSEPNFGRTSRQDHQVNSSKKESSSDAQGNDLGTGSVSRFGRFGFGSQLFQKTVGLVLGPKSSRQAKLGETNRFYYDEKLKRWVEEGAEPPAEETALLPPPTTAAFQNSTSDFGGVKSMSEMSSVGGSPGFMTPSPDNSSGMPPVVSTSNQFSARGRMGARARYVDTFNQGRTNVVSSFKSPGAPPIKPPLAANAKLFVPTVPVQTDEWNAGSRGEAIPEGNPAEAENPLTSCVSEPFHTPTSSTPTMQRFPSMDHIPANPNRHLSGHSRRTMSWGEGFEAMACPLGKSEAKPLCMPSPGSSNGIGDEFREVEL